MRARAQYALLPDHRGRGNEEAARLGRDVLLLLSALAASPSVPQQDELREALRDLLRAYEVALEHIIEDLQPAFQRLAEEGKLPWPNSWRETPYDQSQAAWRLATWFHGVGCDEIIERARDALASSQVDGDS